MDPADTEKKAVPGIQSDSETPEPKQEVASLFQKVDPIAIGGAVGGMTAGEVIGGAIGGLIGAVAGPGGAAIGVGLGAFAGTTIGAKLGYDVTHEIVHPEDTDPNASLKERARAVAKTTAGKAGDAVGGGIGAAGGALVGTVLAGPLGGKVGSFVGEAIAGELGEERAVDLYAISERRVAKSDAAAPAHEARNESSHPMTKAWLAKVASETAGETGLAVTLGAVGGLIAGNPGRTLGRRAGTLLAKQLNRALPFKWKRQSLSQQQSAADATEKVIEPRSPGQGPDGETSV